MLLYRLFLLDQRHVHAAKYLADEHLVIGIAILCKIGASVASIARHNGYVHEPLVTPGFQDMAVTWAATRVGYRKLMWYVKSFSDELAWRFDGHRQSAFTQTIADMERQENDLWKRLPKGGHWYPTLVDPDTEIARARYGKVALERSMSGERIEYTKRKPPQWLVSMVGEGVCEYVHIPNRRVRIEIAGS